MFFIEYEYLKKIFEQLKFDVIIWLVIKMNIKSEQLRSDLSLDIDLDQPLSPKELQNTIISALGKENCKVINVNSKKAVEYKKENGKIEILLLSAVTYMGGNGQHPIFKKRSQLKPWFKDVVMQYQNNQDSNVRFIGVYHYEGNIIFLDYEKETFLKKKMNNSAVHIYTNDLFQAMKNGSFTRIDNNNNIIHAVKYTKFSNYLNDKSSSVPNHLFDLFKNFNRGFCFGSWITAMETIPKMHDDNWSKWKETEWPGWYLEYEFDKYCKNNHLEPEMQYVGSSLKREGDLDFDVWFDLDNFYGDLKASDITKHEAPGNDKNNFIECINLYDKFWYILYEHETIKDNENNNYEATRFRSNYVWSIGEWDKKKPFDELSYYTRMKHSVKFVKMTIIELNRINYREALNDFNQGRQPDGNARKPKLKINKRNIENFIVFSHKYFEVTE